MGIETPKEGGGVSQRFIPPKMKLDGCVISAVDGFSINLNISLSIIVFITTNDH